MADKEECLTNDPIRRGAVTTMIRSDSVPAANRPAPFPGGVSGKLASGRFASHKAYGRLFVDLQRVALRLSDDGVEITGLALLGLPRRHGATLAGTTWGVPAGPLASWSRTG